MEIRGYSIWYVPEAAASEPLQALIAALAQESDAPLFEPHITLLGQIDGAENRLLEKVKVFAGLVSPFQVRFTQLGMQANYFRSLYLKVGPDNVLQRLHQQALAHFKVSVTTPYLPHLSLLYSHLEPQAKQKLLEKHPFSLPRPVTISSLALIRTRGSVGHWELVDQRPLS